MQSYRVATQPIGLSVRPTASSNSRQANNPPSVVITEPGNRSIRPRSKSSLSASPFDSPARPHQGRTSHGPQLSQGGGQDRIASVPSRPPAPIRSPTRAPARTAATYWAACCASRIRSAGRLRRRERSPATTSASSYAGWRGFCAPSSGPSFPRRWPPKSAKNDRSRPTLWAGTKASGVSLSRRLKADDGYAQFGRDRLKLS